MPPTSITVIIAIDKPHAILSYKTIQKRQSPPTHQKPSKMTIGIVSARPITISILALTIPFLLLTYLNRTMLLGIT